MRLPVSYAALGSALGLALAAGGSSAHAQTVITPAVVDQPVVTMPAVVQQTTETVRTVRPAPLRSTRREVVTTRTITRRMLPTTTTTVIARTVPAAPRPLYDEVAPAPVVTTPQPLYDEVAAPMAPTPMVATSPVVEGGVVASEPYTYRYIYQPDRILVIDPATGIAVQSIPR